MPSVESLVDDVIRAADTLRELPPPESLVQALNRLATEDTTRTGRVRMAARLRDVTSPAGCGFLCICLGASVEGDADPAPVTPLIIDAMLQWIATIPRPEDRPREDRPGQAEMQAVRDRLGYTLEDADSDDDPIDLPPELSHGLDWMGQGLVAHLSRDEPARQVLASRSDAVAELDRAAGHCNGATWVLELLRKRSGELVVIHVPSGRGVLAKFENISNGFHLFTLLQGALSGVIPGAGFPNGRALAVARGEAQAAVSDSARWHFGRGDVPQADLSGSIWGEGSPDEIPEIDGAKVVLLWKPILGSRSWDAGFFGPHLQAAPSNVTVVRPLSDEELLRWRERLGLPKPNAPWWKFWRRS